MGRSGRGGRAGRGRGGRGYARTRSSASTSKASNTGLSKDLDAHIFDYGKRGSADQLRTTWDKIIKYVGSTLGEHIGTELRNKRTYVIPEPEFPQDVLDRHARFVEEITQDRVTKLADLTEIQTIYTSHIATLTVGSTEHMNLKRELAVLKGQISAAERETRADVEMKMTAAEQSKHDNAMKTHSSWTAKLQENRGKAFSIISGQCTQLLEDKMKQDADWETVMQSCDPLTLYRLIEKTILAQTEDQYPYAVVHDQEMALYGLWQGNQSNAQWYDRFNTRLDVGVAIGIARRHHNLLDYEADLQYDQKFVDLDPEVQEELVHFTEEAYNSYLLIRHSSHKKLIEDLADGHVTGNKAYPKTRALALRYLDTYKKKHEPKPEPSDGSVFIQNGKKEYDKTFWAGKKCFNCNKMGHPATHCKEPKAKKKGGDDDDKSVASAKSVSKVSKSVNKLQKSVDTLLVQLKEAEESEVSGSDDDEETSLFQLCSPVETSSTAKIFAQAKSARKDLDLREVILADSQSTTDIFCNEKLVEQTFRSRSKLNLKSNGGTMVVHRKAKVPGYGMNVWFSTRAIANILSLKNLAAQFHVTYDSYDERFVVHRESAGLPNMEFVMHESGLHYYDPRQYNAHAFVNTVYENKQGFSKRQIKGAEAARTLYATLHYPSMKDFKWILRSNQIKNCPVTVNDAENAVAIWGKNIAALKGKTTRSKPSPVAADFIKIPPELLKIKKDVFLTADIFFVNKIPFLLTLSRNICLTTVRDLESRKAEVIFQGFKDIYQKYLQRGFRIGVVHVDGELESVKAQIESMPYGPIVNVTSANEHVPEIERRIRVVKERSRATRHSLPYSRIPKIMTIYIVQNVVRMLNFFPTKGSVSENLSPKTIMTGGVLDFKKDLSLQVGQYCQVHEEHEPRNSQRARTKGAIALGPTGNLQGGFKFMSLDTGMKITRRSWDVIPINDLVINRVNALGHDQPEDMVFLDRRGRPIGDIEIPGVDASDEAGPSLDDFQLPGVDPIVEDAIEIPGVDAEGPQDPFQDAEEEIDDLEAEEPMEETVGVEAPVAAPVAAEVNLNPNQGQAQGQVPAEQEGLRRSTRVRTQPKRYTPSMTGSRYAYAAAQLEYTGVLNPDAHMFVQEDFYQSEPDVVAMIMTQLSLKAGLKTWGDKAYAAAKAEMKQLHLRDTFKPKHWDELTEEERRSILPSHLFLKEKRGTGEIKGRTVAGGNKQRAYIPKEDASSPTVMTESVMLTAIIDAEEGRDTAVVDIPNAFIQTRVENDKDKVIIRLRGVLVEILLEIAPEVYKPYVTTDKKGVKQLLVQCLNALYGTMVASLLYYRKFVKSLTDIGFEINPYDPCVANKMVKGKQMTICFHVDDCKISHKHPKQVDKMINYLRKEYESIFEDGSGAMKVSRGPVHKYLGMTLDYSVRGQVSISMYDYIEEILDAFNKVAPKEAGTKSSAAPENLFTVNEDCEKLSHDEAVAFHNIVAKTLYATKRARPDTCTSVSFLTTRVREPDKDDWKKMCHLMRYIRGTRKLPLILSANGTSILKWWVDASFAVHPNMRGHTGGGLSLGRGFPIMSSTKQKLNARSSTESEIIGVDDLMPAICWTRYFLEAQGYLIYDNIVFQDNMSSILLEKNGKASSSKRTKHINIRYFFITDRVANKEVSVVWCPTGDMIGDYATKPLQGALFRKFRDQIMGVTPVVEPGQGKSTGTEKPEPTVRKPDAGKDKGKTVAKKKSLAPSKKGRNHRSVLELVLSKRAAERRKSPDASASTGSPPTQASG